MLLAFLSLPCRLLAGDPPNVKTLPEMQIISEDVYPAWTQVHFQVQPGTWATIVEDELAQHILNASFSYRDKVFDIPRPCLDDLDTALLETAAIGFGGDRVWLKFKTMTFDENGNGQDDKDMTHVRFIAENGVLIQREVIKYKNNNQISWLVVDLSKGLSKSDIDADRCGTPESLPKVKNK
jgi:hypothetical protein